MSKKMKLLARPRFVEQVTLADLKFDDVVEVFDGWVRVDAVEVEGGNARLTFDGYPPMTKPSDVPVHRAYGPDPKLLCSVCRAELAYWVAVFQPVADGGEEELTACEGHIGDVLVEATGGDYEGAATVRRFG